MNLRLDVAYDGRPFHGYARQRDVRTVQGDLEAALYRVLRTEVSTAVAGRTDAGVHALGQVVSVAEVPEDVDLEALRHALNANLAPYVSVWAITPAAADFHARFSARSRTYLYAILTGESPDPFLAPTTLYHPKELDLAAMNEAAGHLVGHHDFSSFGRAPEPGASAERVLFELRCSREGSLIRVRARANAFIQQMVRALVGTLLHVGVAKIGPDDVPGILEGRDRGRAGPVAPPHGLCLVSVEYDDSWKAPFTA